MNLLPLIVAQGSAANLAIGWTAVVLGTLIGALLVAMPGKRKSPSADDHA
jgi:uncharacterized membrane protein